MIEKTRYARRSRCAVNYSASGCAKSDKDSFSEFLLLQSLVQNKNLNRVLPITILKVLFQN